MPVPLKVRGIGTLRYKLEEFAFTAFNMTSLDQRGSEVYTCIKYKLHLVEGLKANIFIGNDVFYIEGFTINLTNAFAYILSCGMTIIMNARNHSQFLNCNILANAIIFVPPKSETFVNFWQISLPDSRNFPFQPFHQQHLTLYFHLFNYTSLKIFV